MNEIIVNGKKYRLHVPNAVKASFVGTATATALGYAVPSSAQDVPPEVQKGIDTSAATIQALGGLSGVALSVALIPFGSFLALAFIAKVMSRV